MKIEIIFTTERSPDRLSVPQSFQYDSMQTFSWRRFCLHKPTSNVIFITLANWVFPKLISYECYEQYKSGTYYNSPKITKSDSPLCQSHCHFIEKSILLNNLKISVATIIDDNIIAVAIT